MTLNWLLLVLVIFVPTINSFEPIDRISAILGRDALLPCETRTLGTIRLILWHRENNSIPFYSIDYRNSSTPKAIISGETNHANSSQRFIHDFRGLNPFLRIRNVTESDAGIYRCRVEYSSYRTFQNDVRLNVIGAPTVLEIYDSNSRVIQDQILGPFNEHENLTLACVAYGGKPKPQVYWYKRLGYSEELIDSSYEYRPLTTAMHGALSSIVNILSRKLTRTDYRAMFICRSVTSGYRPVLERSIRVDLNLPPSSVRIFSLSPFSVYPTSFSMRSNELTTIGCRSDGSQPPATLEWLLDNIPQNQSNPKFVSIITTTSQNGTTLSVIRFLPGPDDNGRTLACRAHNSLIGNSSHATGPGALSSHSLSLSTLVDRITLNVLYSPKLEIVPGKFTKELQNSTEILVPESEFGYFDLHCNVRANPWIGSVTWSVNEIDIVIHSSGTLSEQLPLKAGSGESSVRASPLPFSSSGSSRLPLGGVHFRTLNSNRTLRLLSPDSASHSGLYRCRATNAIGEASSLPTKVQIGYKPKCAVGNRFVEVERKKKSAFHCEIDAIPRENVSVRWTVSWPWKDNEKVIDMDESNNNISNGQNLNDSKNNERIVELNSTQLTIVVDVEQLLEYFDVNYNRFKPLLLQCYANNSVGMQINPCTFMLNIRDGPPEQLRNCKLKAFSQAPDSSAESRAAGFGETRLVQCSKLMNDNCTKVASFRLLALYIPTTALFTSSSPSSSPAFTSSQEIPAITTTKDSETLKEIESILEKYFWNESIELTQLIAEHNESMTLPLGGKIAYTITNFVEPSFILPFAHRIDGKTFNNSIEVDDLSTKLKEIHANTTIVNFGWNDSENIKATNNTNLFEILLLWSENVNGPSRPTFVYRKFTDNSNIAEIASRNINTSESVNKHRSNNQAENRATKSAIVVLLLVTLILVAGSLIRRSFYRTDSTEDNFHEDFNPHDSPNDTDINDHSLLRNQHNSHDSLLNNEKNDNQSNTKQEDEKNDVNKEYSDVVGNEYVDEIERNSRLSATDSRTTEPEVLLESFVGTLEMSGRCNEHDRISCAEPDILPEASNCAEDVDKVSPHQHRSYLADNGRLTWRQYCNRLFHNSHYKSYKLASEQENQNDDSNGEYYRFSVQRTRWRQGFVANLARYCQWNAQWANQRHRQQRSSCSKNRVKLLNMFESDFA